MPDITLPAGGSMTGIRLGVAAAVLIVLSPARSAAQSLDASRIRDAATRGFAAIQAAQRVSRTTQSCTTTCHLQVYGALAYRSAREHGIPLDEEIARTDADRAFRRGFGTSLSAAVEDNALGEVAMNQAFFLVAAHAVGLHASLVTAALARAVALEQNPAGDWTALQERPPSNHSRFTFTALGMRALQLYGHPRQKDDVATRVARAKAWLQAHAALDTEDRTYQLLGLSWAGADRSVLATLSKALAAEQRADGGWNSLAGRDSDAYSTGEALVALHDGGGMPTTDPVWRRGVEFLLRGQAPDGSWHVRTRLPPWVSPPYFESGYPYGRDQFISVAGANWSVRALALALGAPTAAERLPLADVEPAAIEPWVETAMFGTVAEVKQLLDNGLSPDAATAVGRTSLLMMALPDLEKVKLLLDRGANVNARSARKYSALLVGAQYRESTPAIRLLLARGAEIGVPAADGKPAADAFPTFFASHTGNADVLPALRQAGDKLDDSAIMFGAAPVSPLGVAVLYNHVDTVRTLIELGAKVDPTDRRADSPLVSAVVANHTEIVRLLIARGADVNRVDNTGMTPLMYAAVADFGDSAIVDLLLTSGARTDVRAKDGLTAADYARKYNHPQVIARLEKTPARPRIR
jgi:ankyrin repeat protein